MLPCKVGGAVVATDNVVAEHVDPRCFSNHSLLLFLFWPESRKEQQQLADNGLTTTKERKLHVAPQDDEDLQEVRGADKSYRLFGDFYQQSFFLFKIFDRIDYLIYITNNLKLKKLGEVGLGCLKTLKNETFGIDGIDVI